MGTGKGLLFLPFHCRHFCNLVLFLFLQNRNGILLFHCLPCAFGTRYCGNSAVHSHQHASILDSWTWELLEIILGRSQELATMHFLVVGSNEALRFVTLIVADGG